MPISVIRVGAPILAVQTVRLLENVFIQVVVLTLLTLVGSSEEVFELSHVMDNRSVKLMYVILTLTDPHLGLQDRLGVDRMLSPH